jgi:methyl-accepting chemotaxis protein
LLSWTIHRPLTRSEVADAVRRVADAVRRVADAVRKVADAVRKVADAVRKVADAVRKVADAVRRDLCNVAKAREMNYFRIFAGSIRHER